MTRLAGAAAFQALADFLAGRSDAAIAFEEPGFERLREALREQPRRASARDLLVLLRQALQREHARRGGAQAPELLVTHAAFAGAVWGEAGLEARPSPAGPRVSARSWCPTWLPNTAESVEARAAAEYPCRFGEGSGAVGDPFLAAVGRAHYRSTGQRAAVRAALSTPPGAALAVALATGEGKSLIFQLVQTVGFSGADTGGLAGTTLVIVPTVALAIDHEAAALCLPGHRLPLAYRSGAEANQLLAERIRDGSQGLCFASPEAACGPLRRALVEAATRGTLRALVIDEAHLVDQWGTGFRTEFQELSGLRRELLSTAPDGRQPRTLLLSATLTETSLATLETLFGEGSAFASIAAVQLRPEPDYWIAAPCDSSEREQRVLEALAHAPRPAILYVTQVEHAEAWYRLLKNAGYGRLKRLHGDTRAGEREEILRLWRGGRLDIVVGTSAFGLGIDYLHARTIIHACVPETLDRFYQEVGRGGRDGRASLSIALPADEDFGPAERLGEQRVISLDRGRTRWNAMFETRVPLADGQVAVDVDVRPSASEEDIDMGGELNTEWNVRTLTLLARADMVQLVGRPENKIEMEGDWLAVRILNDGSTLASTWEARVKPVRSGIAEASEHNFKLMRRFLDGNDCPTRIFSDLYGAAKVIATCSRCTLCRANPARASNLALAAEPVSPWPAGSLSAQLERIVGAGGRLLVLDDPNERGPEWYRRFADLLPRMATHGVAKLVLLGATSLDEERAFAKLRDRPVFVARTDSLVATMLPPGPELIVVGANARLSPANLNTRDPGRERIFIAPLDLPHPSKPDLLLADLFPGARLGFDQFYGRVAA